MAVTTYASTDTSAPVLSGQVGKLRDLLKACLVDGYGSKTAAGWAEAFTGTNKAAYRAAAGARHYFRLDDNGTGTGGAKEALIRGFETMTDVDTGTGPFPTAAQSALTASSLIARKSATADATARAWYVIADDRTCYVFVKTGDNASNYLAFAFGEFYSLLPSDAYRSICIGRTSENSATLTADTLDKLQVALSNATLGHFCPRGYTQLGTSVNLGKHGDSVKGNGSLFTVGNVPFPNPPDGGLYLSPIWVHDPTTVPVNNVRGRMRGFWHFLHTAASIADLDTVTGVGDLAGKTFLFLKLGGNAGVYTMETSNTWETN